MQYNNIIININITSINLGIQLFLIILRRFDMPQYVHKLYEYHTLYRHNMPL